MVFSSLLFLFRFLPAVLILYYIAPRKLRNVILLLFSLFFYAWGEPKYVFLMLFTITMDFFIGKGIDKAKKEGNQKKAKRFLMISILVDLSILGFFKYAGFLVSMINAILPLKIEFRSLALPVGISFYTFQALSYVIDVYRKKVKPQENLLNFAVYITMFPQLVAGPIVKYSDIELQLSNRKISRAKFGQGIERLLFGLSKKVLLANNLGLLYETIQASGSRSIMTSWLGIFAYTLQIYFDFSGYSDMAIGMGKMLGFTFPENFNFPYISDSITEFWRRWHMTLSGWFREYVYIPLGGNRVSKPRHILNLLIVWVLTGFWHGAAWNFILWGLYYGILLILEKYIFAPLLKKLPKAARHIYTMLLVMFGWVLFSNTDFGSMRTYVGTLFGIGTKGFLDLAFFYYIRNNLIILIMGVLCATPLIRNYIVRCSRKKPEVTSAVLLLLGILSIAFLVYGTYNPFLYFRF